MQGLRRVRSLGEAEAIAAIVRVLHETATLPGARLALLTVEGNETGAQIFDVVVSLPGEASDSDGAAGTMTPGGQSLGIVRYWSREGRMYLAFQIDPQAEFTQQEFMLAVASLERSFHEHRADTSDGVELMLDLENLRRAWPDALAEGSARRAVAVTGLANARKIHVHVPSSGAVRLAYSSRAEPADRVTTRLGPDPVGGADLGVRWPNVFDASLRLYAICLDEQARLAFSEQFQDWMGRNGNRLRGLIQATEVGLDWSVEATDEGGLRLSLTIPIREGVSAQALADAAGATLRDSGFEVDGSRATLELPEAVADALGGATLNIEVDVEATPMAYRIVVE